jgi:hypothetical protein
MLASGGLDHASEHRHFKEPGDVSQAGSSLPAIRGQHHDRSALASCQNARVVAKAREKNSETLRGSPTPVLAIWRASGGVWPELV